MQNFKVGDKIKNGSSTNTIIEVCGKLVAMYFGSEIKWYEEIAMVRGGWTLEQSAPWVPEVGSDYWYMISSGNETMEEWAGTDDDLFRFSIGNVHKTKEDCTAWIALLVERMGKGKV